VTSSAHYARRLEAGQRKPVMPESRHERKLAAIVVAVLVAADAHRAVARRNGRYGSPPEAAS
jgi:hypothetical protein